MNYKYFFILFFGTICTIVYGQDETQILQGKVTFVTSKNIYVKFESTKMIKVGDTLQTLDKIKCLLVSHKSSSSVVCAKINDCDISKDTAVVFDYVSVVEEITAEKETIGEEIDISYNDSIQAIEKKSMKTSYNENIKARLSASSYSAFSSNRDDNHRLMSRFSLNADHINHSKLSVDTYLNYRNYLSSGGTNSLKKNVLKVYNFALIYDVDSTLSVTVGRKINYKISSLGSIDGIQAEKFLGKNYVGVIAGFRPNINDYGFNANLLQYGVFVGRLTDSRNLRSQTTLGIAEQKNHNEVDRRFTYFQHSSTIFKKLNLFSTAELDIFNKANDSINNGPRLTNLYVSARYRFNKTVNMALSYDSRKQIIYYKTYETDIEELLDEDIARQGIRARLNIRPSKKMFTGFSYSKRFQSDNQNKSENMYGYVSYSKLPSIGGRISLTYNMNASNYLDSKIASLRYATAFMEDRLNADFYYRIVNYVYKSDIPNFSQNYFGAHFSYYLDRSLIVSLSGEYSTYESVNNYRINAQIIKRFYRQRKK
jgi:hypothetical protein